MTWCWCWCQRARLLIGADTSVCVCVCVRGHGGTRLLRLFAPRAVRLAPVAPQRVQGIRRRLRRRGLGRAQNDAAQRARRRACTRCGGLKIRCRKSVGVGSADATILRTTTATAGRNTAALFRRRQVTWRCRGLASLSWFDHYLLDYYVVLDTYAVLLGVGKICMFMYCRYGTVPSSFVHDCEF